MAPVNPGKVVARRLLDEPQPAPAGWKLSTLDELGPEAFNQIMLRASDGDPYDTSTAESAEDDFRELVEAAGTAFDAGSWFVLSDAHGDVGVVLPQVVPEDLTTGTLFYVAVLPERRGEGLGRAVHAFGLSELARRGARSYVGSTDPDNTPMIAIFEANGCTLS